MVGVFGVEVGQVAGIQNAPANRIGAQEEVVESESRERFSPGPVDLVRRTVGRWVAAAIEIDPILGRLADLVCLFFGVEVPAYEGGLPGSYLGHPTPQVSQLAGIAVSTLSQVRRDCQQVTDRCLQGRAQGQATYKGRLPGLKLADLGGLLWKSAENGHAFLKTVALAAVGGGKGMRHLQALGQP